MSQPWQPGPHAEPAAPQEEAPKLEDQSLREQRTELVRMMAELRSMHEAIRGQKPDDLERLRRENEQLRQLQVQHEEDSHATAADIPEPAVFQELQELRSQNQQLRRLLEEKDSLLQGLRHEESAPGGELVDLESFEAELNQFRQQLEADRKKLNAERDQVRMRNEELDEATREMEMEFSRERAELARERTRLERLREEVRIEMDRIQRDSAMRESLTGVQRLRERLAK